MITLILMAFLPVVPVLYWRYLPKEAQDARALYIVLLGLLPRLIFANIVRNFSFFSYGNSGDAVGYENLSSVISKIWSFEGIHYVTQTELPPLNEATLPPNLFALMDYVNGGPAHLANTALVATIATLTLLNMYSVALELGASRETAVRMLALLTFLPTFVFYTADTHKDGLVSFFVFGTFGCALRNARKFSAGHLLLAAFYLVGLWLTRYYLVFVMAMPLLIGLLGVRELSPTRMALITSLLAVAGIAIVAYSQALTSASDTFTSAYSRGTSDALISSNAQGGSGVVITSSGPVGFLERLAYTLFAPFPWQSGSIAVQLEKFEMPIWYYCAYLVIRNFRRMWRERASDLILFGSWMVPTVLAYTLSFSNVGLALRERINVVLATILLSSFARRREDSAAGADGAALSPATS